MSLFIISDLHLSFSSNKPMDRFGPMWKSHDEKIRLAWNSMVGENDTVILGGDTSWALKLKETKDDLLYLDSLKGHKLLIKGNHDYWWDSVSKVERFLDELGIKSVSLLQNNAFVTDDFIIAGTRGWYSEDELAPEETDYEKMIAREAMRMKMSLDHALLEREKEENRCKEIIAVTHFPIVFGDYVFEELEDQIAAVGIKRAFFGHIHSVFNIPRTRERRGISHTLTSCDFLRFVPLKIEKKTEDTI